MATNTNRRDKMKAFGLHTITFILLLAGCSTDRKLDSIDDVNKYASGIWVGNTGSTFGSTIFWMKYVINTDGTYTEYYAPAARDNWGEPIESGSWVARTGKYSDSGERFFYIELNDKPSEQRFQGRGLETAVLLSSTNLQWRAKEGESPLLKLWIRSARMSSTSLPTPRDVVIDLTRGDKFPFSK